MYLNHLEYHCAGGIFPNGEQNPARGDGSDKSRPQEQDQEEALVV